MKLIIDIPEEIYHKTIEGIYEGEESDCLIVDTFTYAIENGTPLSESEDCVSRQAVLNRISKQRKGLQPELYPQDKIGDAAYGICDEFIRRIPPVTPKQRTGQWEQTGDIFINKRGQFVYQFICSECDALSHFRKSNKKIIGADICPNCGAKMGGEQE